MLSKLMKYDLKSMFKVFIPLWAALVVVSLINRFTIRMTEYDAPQVISMMLYVFLFSAVLIVAVVLIIMRFYNGLLKDEGYLMFTLPVKPWQLVTSKCLTASIVILLSLIIGAGSVLLVAVDAEVLWEIRHFFAEIAPYWTGDMTLAVVLGVLLMFASIVASVTHVYASLAIGHLANHHRIGWAVAAYIGINMIFTIIGTVFVNVTRDWNFHIEFNAAYPMVITNCVLAILLGVCLVQIAIFYVATERILSKKLNLE